jgi:4-diphosphocytidyl-2-C-methyl-D-erythritol kinase
VSDRAPAAEWSVTTTAPAKLNLTLRVLGVRPDGYHELDALTVTVDSPADTITLEAVDGNDVTVAVVDGGPDVPTGEANLAVRAARALLPAGHGLRLMLTKRTPAGAGLGGGSADAAAVLRVLRDRHEVDPDSVMAVAVALGSDVPVCVEGRPVMLRGRGELLEPVALAGELHVVIATPGFALSTPAVFRAWDDLAGSGRSRTVAAPAAVGHLVPDLVNDLEPAAERVAPALVPFREALRAAAGAEPLLAGSGSSYWLPVADAETATFVAARVRAELNVETFAGRVLRGAPG